MVVIGRGVYASTSSYLCFVVTMAMVVLIIPVIPCTKYQQCTGILCIAYTLTNHIAYLYHIDRITYMYQSYMPNPYIISFSFLHLIILNVQHACMRMVYIPEVADRDHMYI